MSLIFNPGDRVRVASAVSKYHQKYVGVTGSVRASYPDRIEVIPDAEFIDDNRFCGSGYWNFRDGEFKLEPEFNAAEYEDDIT